MAKKKVKIGTIVYVPALARYGKVAEIREDGRITKLEVPKLPEVLPKDDELLNEIDGVEIINVVNLVIQLFNVFEKLINALKKIKIGKKDGK